MDAFLNHATFSSSMSSNGRSIQDHILEVSVVSGYGLKNTEWLSRQDPYVVVKYGDTQYRTKTCTDGGRNPIFPHAKFQFKLIEGLRRFKVLVYNSNTFSTHDLIGYGSVELQEVLSCGYQEYKCLLINETRAAGEIKLTLRYPNAQNAETTYAPRSTSPAPYQRAPFPEPPYQRAPRSAPTFYHTPDPYPPCQTYQPQYTPPPPQQQPHPTYPPQHNYPHSPYSNSNVYPPPPNMYPPSAPPFYPPNSYSYLSARPSSGYPPSPGPSSYYDPSSPYRGSYPRPPY